MPCLTRALPLSSCHPRLVKGYGRDDSPWYPSMRLFRQKTRGDWREVFDRIAEELRRRVEGWSRTRRLVVETGTGELVD